MSAKNNQENMTLMSKSSELINWEITELMKVMQFSTIELRKKTHTGCTHANYPIITQVSAGNSATQQVNAEIYPSSQLCCSEIRGISIRE